MRVKEESEKANLKLDIQKTKIVSSSPITSWQIDGERGRDLIFLGSKITADVHYSHEIKRHFLLGKKEKKKNCDQPRQHILKKRKRLYFADKYLSSQSYGFSSSLV